MLSETHSPRFPGGFSQYLTFLAIAALHHSSTDSPTAAGAIGLIRSLSSALAVGPVSDSSIRTSLDSLARLNLLETNGYFYTLNERSYSLLRAFRLLHCFFELVYPDSPLPDSLPYHLGGGFLDLYIKLFPQRVSEAILDGSEVKNDNLYQEWSLIASKPNFEAVKIPSVVL